MGRELRPANGISASKSGRGQQRRGGPGSRQIIESKLTVFFEAEDGGAMEEAAAALTMRALVWLLWTSLGKGRTIGAWTCNIL
jgi:hypothetical protein